MADEPSARIDALPRAPRWRRLGGGPGERGSRARASSSRRVWYVDIPVDQSGAVDMAEHINGPLNYERLGKHGRPMVFVHPNPMDYNCWLYQMPRFSTWFR